MRISDSINFTWQALIFSKLRTALMLLAMAIGVASVIILSALGEGARHYVVDQFSSMGSNLLIVLPGRSETTGATNPAAFIGETPRDLTLEDAKALQRLSDIQSLAPLIVGASPISHAGLEREVPVFGSTYELEDVMDVHVARGQFLPESSKDKAQSICIIGATVKKELFGNKRAIGQWVRIGERRFRVIGILSDKGQSLGMDMGESVIIPVVSAQSVFNASSLFRILITTKTRDSLDKTRLRVLEIIKQRHQGEEDITVIKQDAILATFDDILKALTASVAGIAAISLAVAGVLIMNVMLIAVSQRTSEIGLFKAVGASPKLIQRIFITEAIFLSILGAACGVIVGYFGTELISHNFPDINFTAPWWAHFSAIFVAIATGVIFGLLPAKKAARLDPVEALYKK